MPYAPGRTHKHDKATLSPKEIVAKLKKRKTGFIVEWSSGHTRGSARVKAFKANAGKHPSWRGVDVSELEFLIWDSGDDGWKVGVRRV